MPHTLHGRALKYKVRHTMKSMQIVPVEQALSPRSNPGGPAHHNRQWLPILKHNNVRMQRGLRGCITKGPGCHKYAGLANHRTYVQSVASSDGPVLGQMSTPSHA